MRGWGAGEGRGPMVYARMSSLEMLPPSPTRPCCVGTDSFDCPRDLAPGSFPRMRVIEEDRARLVQGHLGCLYGHSAWGQDGERRPPEMAHWS